MRLDKANRLVDYGLSEVERVAPINSKIEVDVKEDSSGNFYSLIEVKVKDKIYFVRKNGRSMYESFHKALRAIKSQLARRKINNVHRMRHAHHV